MSRSVGPTAAPGCRARFHTRNFAISRLQLTTLAFGRRDGFTSRLRDRYSTLNFEH